MVQRGAHLTGKDPSRTLNMDFWRELGGAVFWSDLIGQDEGEAPRLELRGAMCAGKALGSKEFREAIHQKVADRVEYDQRMAVA